MLVSVARRQALSEVLEANQEADRKKAIFKASGLGGIKKRELEGVAAGPSGSFSGAALAAMGGSGGDPTQRTARNTERMAGFLGRLVGLTEEQTTAIKGAKPKFT